MIAGADVSSQRPLVQNAALAEHVPPYEQRVPLGSAHGAPLLGDSTGHPGGFLPPSSTAASGPAKSDVLSAGPQPWAIESVESAIAAAIAERRCALRFMRPPFAGGVPPRTRSSSCGGGAWPCERPCSSDRARRGVARLSYNAPVARLLLPLFLVLEGRDVLVVGAGQVAERKIVDLVGAGAHVRVVAPDATAPVRALVEAGSVEWSVRPFVPSDVDGAWLVFAATSDAEVQRAVACASEAARVFCVAVDDVPNTSAYSAAVLRRDPLVVAISSSGEAPALARLLREVLEQALPEASWVDAARALRERWLREGTPMASRFGELVRAFRERASREG